MKRKTLAAVFVSLVAIVAVFLAVVFVPARAATPISGAYTAKAGSGGVTTKTFVKLSAAGTVVKATAVTDMVVGVCEITAAADAQTRYAPIGTRGTVTSGEAIAVGELLTAGTGGKAFVLDTDDASTQRWCAMAITAVDAADNDVTVLLVAGSAEQRLAVTGALKTQASLIVPGFLTGATTSAADSLAIPITHAFVSKTTGADAEALTLANGTAGQLLTISLTTDGGGTGTLTPTTMTGFATIVFADAGDTATLLYVDGTVGWIVVGLAGVTAPPAISV